MPELLWIWRTVCSRLPRGWLDACSCRGRAAASLPVPCGVGPDEAAMHGIHGPCSSCSRGDGPLNGRRPLGPGPASRLRGWSHPALRRRRERLLLPAVRGWPLVDEDDGGGGVPARVGMVPGNGRQSPGPRAAPCLRGDGPVERERHTITSSCSLLVWGWLLHPGEGGQVAVSVPCSCGDGLRPGGLRPRLRPLGFGMRNLYLAVLRVCGVFLSACFGASARSAAPRGGWSRLGFGWW